MWRLETGGLRISFAWSVPGCKCQNKIPKSRAGVGIPSVEKLLLPPPGIEESL
ncbi:hypothetical protein EMPG_12397 [Blastomyces silverae]|uniref:Uncharacterized protein n=1 Tax=Blastomyces silverae TaxID=2060906 RepID=A0A0H1BM23_9EURO|nr:hypothetical protein EMPG_12397 [Blastomyces silverae]